MAKKGKKEKPIAMTPGMDVLKTVAEKKKPFDTLGFIMAYEGGELGEEETIEGFQHLVDTGMAWSLQGHYGRTAAALIDAGYIKSRIGENA